MTSLTTAHGADSVTVIRPRLGWVPLNVRELWRYRDLMLMLALRDVRVRYKQSVLGAAWAILQPLLTMAVFSVLFGLLMGADNKPTPTGVPYAVSTFCALVPWQLFAGAMTLASGSLVADRSLITKVYFPRLITPIAPVLASLVDFVIAFTVLAGMIACYHVFTDYEFHATWALLALPLFVALATLTAIAIALWLSALNAIYRDVRYAIPFLTQILMYVSPVVYATSSILGPDAPAWARLAYGLNPIAGVIEGFRWALVGGPAPGPMLAVSTAAVGALLVGGLYYFKRMERSFADLV